MDNPHFTGLYGNLVFLGLVVAVSLSLHLILTL